jgi:hypothetical protein
MRVTTIYEPKLVELWNERSKRLKQSERQRELRSRMAPLALQSAAAGAASPAQFPGKSASDESRSDA